MSKFGMVTHVEEECISRGQPYPSNYRGAGHSPHNVWYLLHVCAQHKNSTKFCNVIKIDGRNYYGSTHAPCLDKIFGDINADRDLFAVANLTVLCQIQLTVSKHCRNIRNTTDYVKIK